MKVVDFERKVRKGVVCSSFLEFKGLCKDKYNYEGELTAVLDADGTEIDDDYFHTLAPDTTIMILSGDQVWAPPGVSQETGNDNGLSDRVMTALEKIKKKPSTSVGQRRNRNRTVMCTMGMQQFVFRTGKFVLQKSTLQHPNVGPRPHGLGRHDSVEDVKEELTKVFFMNARSHLGKLKNFELIVGNAKGEPIHFPHGTLNSYIDQQMTGKPHLYLSCKQKFPDFETLSTSSDSDGEKMDPRRRSSQATMSPSVPTCSQHHQIDTPGPSYATMSPGPSYATMSSVPSQRHQAPGPSSLPDLMPVINWSNVGTPEHKDPDFMETDTPTIQFKADCNNNLCNICCERDRSSYFQPSGHTFCTVCAVQQQSMSNVCSICRQRIAKVCNLYN